MLDESGIMQDWLSFGLQKPSIVLMALSVRRADVFCLRLISGNVLKGIRN